MATKRTWTGLDSADQFALSTTPEPNTGCWLWFGGAGPQGEYGSIYDRKKKRSVRVNRWAFEHFKRILEKGEVVRHSCDNPHCVNPDHLEAGTQKQNIHDALLRGRRKRKLTFDEFTSIREAYSKGDSSYRLLASEYGVSFSTVSLVVNGKYYTFLEDQ